MFDTATIERMADTFAEAVLERIGPTLAAPAADDGWMDSRGAAEYLGLPSVDALHKLTAAREIPFSQDVPGGKCYFLRSELCEWRREKAP